MNFLRSSVGRQNNSGIILIVVLWLMVILSVLAIGLSRQVSVEVQLTRYALARAKAGYAALSGVYYAMQRIEQAGSDSVTKNADTQYQCGFRLEHNQTPQEIFKDIGLGDTRFSIAYTVPEEWGEAARRYGFTDEDRKINLNALDASNFKLLALLLQQTACDEESALKIASAVIDWRDQDHEIFNAPHGAEEDFYAGLTEPYPCKNNAFDSVQELLLLKGMTLEIFERVKPYVTVFPRQDRLTVNFNTAPPPVLLALARYYAGARTNTSLLDADSLVEKILVFRRGEDGRDATEDDRRVEFNDMPINEKERVIALTMQRHQTSASRYLRIYVTGTEPAADVSRTVEAVIKRDEMRVVSWQRD